MKKYKCEVCGYIYDPQLGDPDNGIDAFLLPGHVSTVLGLSPFRFVAEDWKRPAIVAGF